MVFRFKPIYSHLPCVTWRDNIFLYQDIHSSSLLRAFLTQRQDMCERRHITVFCNLADEKRNLFHACQKLRSLRRIDVFMITISRFPAAEEHLSCSSVAGRHPFRHPFGDCLGPRQSRFSPGACAPGIRSYQLWLPATCLIVTWRRLKRLAVAIIRIKTPSPCSSY